MDTARRLPGREGISRRRISVMSIPKSKVFPSPSMRYEHEVFRIPAMLRPPDSSWTRNAEGDLGTGLFAVSGHTVFVQFGGGAILLTYE
jgi:hypothetical protein